jgi:hypothetical protein
LIGSSTQLVRSFRILLAIVVCEILELLLEGSRVLGHPLLFRSQLPGLLLRVRSRSQLTDLIRGLTLLVSQLIEILLRLSNSLLQVLRISLLGAVVLIQQPIGILYSAQGLLLRLCLLLRVAALLGITQVLRGVLEITCSLPGLRVILLARHLFELTCHFFEIATQLLNVPLVILRILRLFALALNLRLLASGELGELVFQLLFLLRLLLTFTALHRFVLVPILIQFQFEQIGKIFSTLLTAAATATTAASLADLDVGVESCGSSQELIRLQLRRDRARGVILHQR